MKKYFVTGLLIWLPLAITLLILETLIGWMDHTLLLLPPPWRPEAFGIRIPGLGAVLAVLLVFITGVLATNLIGRRLVHWWDGLLHRIPIVRSIYSSVKQVSDTLLKDSGKSFRKVVLVEFPQPGQWTLAFIVGEPEGQIAAEIGGSLVTVYVPTAPNPTSGRYQRRRRAQVPCLARRRRPGTQEGALREPSIGGRSQGESGDARG